MIRSELQNYCECIVCKNILLSKRRPRQHRIEVYDTTGDVMNRNLRYHGRCQPQIEVYDSVILWAVNLWYRVTSITPTDQWSCSDWTSPVTRQTGVKISNYPTLNIDQAAGNPWIGRHTKDLATSLIALIKPHLRLLCLTLSAIKWSLSPLFV